MAAGTRWPCGRDDTAALVWKVETRRAPAGPFDSAWTSDRFSSAVRPDGTANGNCGGDACGANRLLEPGGRAPAIDAHRFANTPGEWGNPDAQSNNTPTGTSAALSDSVWPVHFDPGAALPGNGKTGGRPVRLVRSAP